MRNGRGAVGFLKGDANWGRSLRVGGFVSEASAQNTLLTVEKLSNICTNVHILS